MPPRIRRHALLPDRLTVGVLAGRVLVGLLVGGAVVGAATAGRSVLEGAVRTSAESPSPMASSGRPGAIATTPVTTTPVTTTPVTTTPVTPAGTTGSGATPAIAGADGLTADDRLAGLRSTAVPPSGTGRLRVVPGAVAAPGQGTVKRVRIEVEQGLDVDGAAFAAFVLDTLNDPRSWAHGRRVTFARTAGAADIRVVLASPDTSAKLCAPLVTYGRLSCGRGSTAVLTYYRWVKAMPGYGGDRTGYRHYLVNHEVGHLLGHGHQLCPGAGKVAPVMMQQTKGLLGCRPNPWPYP